MRTIVGITGASGMVFARDFIERCPGEKLVIASRWGKRVLLDELGIKPEALAGERVKILPDDDLMASIASGGIPVDSMVVIPCSSSTLAKIAAGVGDTLLTRSAHVTLKQGRKLVLCLRESPLSAIDLGNALRVSQSGGIVMPVSPFFYLKPSGLDELVRQFVDRVIAMVTGKPGEIWKG